jgi:hypothetical protein
LRPGGSFYASSGNTRTISRRRAVVRLSAASAPRVPAHWRVREPTGRRRSRVRACRRRRRDRVLVGQRRGAGPVSRSSSRWVHPDTRRIFPRRRLRTDWCVRVAAPARIVAAFGCVSSARGAAYPRSRESWRLSKFHVVGTGRPANPAESASTRRDAARAAERRSRDATPTQRSPPRLIGGALAVVGPR